MLVEFYPMPSAEALEHPTTREGELLRVALAINAGDSPEQLVDILFDTLSPFVPYDRIAVALLEDTDQLVYRYARSRTPTQLGQGVRSHVKGTSLEPVLCDGKVRIVPDLQALLEAKPDSETTPPLVAEGMRSNLTLPLVTSRRPIGVVFFTSRQPAAYSPHHVQFLWTLAAALGSAFERASLIAELRRANAELRSLETLKRNFLGNLSHELRTPLSIVTSYLSTVQEELAGPLSDEQKRYLQVALDAADRLKDLLNVLFDFTALETGALELEHQMMDLMAIAREVVNDLRPAIAQAGLSLEVDLDAAAWVEGDPPHLAQLLHSLVDNARKFTPAPGRITVRGGQCGMRAWIAVTDTGIGIGPEHRRHIFEKFYQVESGPTRTLGGVGLGLPLARAIAEAHGGTLTMKSELGEGSTFRLELPAIGAPEGGTP